jgi:hypothetical protein
MATEVIAERTLGDSVRLAERITCDWPALIVAKNEVRDLILRRALWHAASVPAIHGSFNVGSLDAYGSRVIGSSSK